MKRLQILPADYEPFQSVKRLLKKDIEINKDKQIALLNLRENLKETPNSFRKKAREDFCQWIDAVEVPSELKHFVAEVDKILGGDTLHQTLSSPSGIGECFFCRISSNNNKLICPSCIEKVNKTKTANLSFRQKLTSWILLLEENIKPDLT